MPDKPKAVYVVELQVHRLPYGTLPTHDCAGIYRDKDEAETALSSLAQCGMEDTEFVICPDCHTLVNMREPEPACKCGPFGLG